MLQGIVLCGLCGREDLPKLWSAPSTTNADRKQIIRMIIKDVVLDRRRERGKVWFKINWQTGAISEHRINRRIGSYQEHAEIERLRMWIAELNAEAKTDVEIAAILMRNLWGIRAHWRYQAGHNPQKWDDGRYSIQGAAAAIGVTVLTVHSWPRRGLLDGRQSAEGAPWKITLTEEQIAGDPSKEVLSTAIP